MGKISALYFMKGYLQVKVEKPKVAFKKDGIYIDFYIKEGDQFKVGTINLEGDIIAEKDILLKETKLKPEMIFNQKLVQEDIMKITEMSAGSIYKFLPKNLGEKTNE